MIYFYELSLKKIREKKQEYISALAEGKPQSFEAYKFLCGKIHGFEEAEEELRQLFNTLQNNKVERNTRENAQLY
jgi:hypothetical protein